MSDVVLEGITITLVEREAATLRDHLIKTSWRDLATCAPPPNVPLIWGGPSGYKPLHDWHQESGYYEPISPSKIFCCRTDSHDDYTAAWPAPTHWRPADPRPTITAPGRN